MSIDSRLLEITMLQRDLTSMHEEMRASSGGSGGGSGEQMDQRVKRLEGQFDRLTDRIGALEVQLATLVERVAHLPSKGFIVTALVTSVAVLSGLAAIAQRLGFFS